MTIVSNAPCPKCRKNGHDKTGDHLMIFENGAGYCNHSQYHKNGKPYHTANGAKPVEFNGKAITGDIRYTAEQFRELEKAGLFKDNQFLRELALGGMKEKVRYEVLTKKEKEKLRKQWKLDMKHFESLPVKNLISRGIRGEIAKLYNVRVGSDKDGKVARHYYPCYEFDGTLQGAFCRNLPKDFRSGSLGKLWGRMLLGGMQVNNKVAKSGARKKRCMIVAGYPDMMAAQQMLLDSKEGTRFEGQYEYIFTVNRGENAYQEIVDNLPKLKKFKQVVLGFDSDKVGQDFVDKCANLFRGKAYTIQYPEGCKDPNDCLLNDKEEEFVDAWWNVEEYKGSAILTAADLYDKCMEEVTYGLSWPWPSLNEMTFGIRPYNLYVIGGGSGVGKTEIAKELIEFLITEHKELVGVIFMEEPPEFTLKVLAGKYINKKLHMPPNKYPKGHELYDPAREYTKSELQAAVKRLVSIDRVRIANCKGDTSIDNIMEQCDYLRAIGCTKIFIDNLTTISHKGNEGSVKAIDESMKRFGTYIQEQPVSIFLLSHLAKPDDSRTPFEDGGAVRQADFRGSQSIAFWATFMLGVERNTNAVGADKLETRLRCVKDRLTGMHTGEVVYIYGNENTGRLREADSSTNKKSEKRSSKGKENSKSKKKSKTDKKMSKDKEF